MRETTGSRGTETRLRSVRASQQGRQGGKFMSDIETILKLIADANVETVDFRFTDPRGK
jgi:hypothetical protein